MTVLDLIPNSEWFFCIPRWIAVYCITGLGIIHPLFWIGVMRVYASELFTFMYVLVFFWSLLSCLLVYAILMGSHCIYSFWIWYTLAFCLAMELMMFILFVGFCVLATRRRAVVAFVAITYYIVTVYFVMVVNQQRKEEFGLNATCASLSIKQNLSLRMLAETTPPTTTSPDALSTTALTTTTTETTTISTTNTETSTIETTTLKTNTTPPTTLTTTNPLTSPMTTASPAITQPTSSTMNPAMAAFFARAYEDDDFIDNALTDTRRENPHRDDRAVEVLTPRTPVPRHAAIAMLSDLLVNSSICLKPLKPAHGKFHKRGRRGGPSFQLTLHCNEGYQETTVTTKCMNNWWDNPIPQCRKRKPPDPTPLPGGGCIMPGYPAHGEYRVVEHPSARPDDLILGDNIVLLVACDEPYRAVDPYVICVEGRWKHAPPSCLKHCKLIFNPTVKYQCLDTFKDDLLTCQSLQPDGAVVVASCKPGYAYRGPFRYMKCRGEAWNHVVTCQPYANFTS